MDISPTLVESLHSALSSLGSDMGEENGERREGLGEGTWWQRASVIEADVVNYTAHHVPSADLVVCVGLFGYVVS